MVSFQCEGCGDVLTKKKLDPHRNRCRGATFSCIDCMSCMTEDQKYQGALYRNKKAKTTPSANTPVPPAPAPAPPPAIAAMAQPAYVEDVQDEQWRQYEVDSDDEAPLPEAPTPPSAAEANVNVFDFLVNATPTASNISLPATALIELSEDTQLVRFDHEANSELEKIDEEAMIQYGTGPVPTNFQTPAPKALRKKSKDSEKDLKKDKKRKRLHVDTDQIMQDAPPVMHSGLTGGLNRLMSRPSVFPPSPDYSGGDVAETPASPLKKSKSKHHKSRPEHIGNSLMAMITAGSKPAKTKKRTSTSTSTKKKHTKRLEGGKEPKLIEYRPGSKDSKDGGDHHHMVIFKPRAEQFFSYINKGPESERGCSINKVLKRYHRERNASTGVSKLVEEKELWRTLRVRKNERGEIVLFSA